MSNSPEARAAIRATILAVLVGLLIDTLTSEPGTAPTYIAKGYAIILTGASISWWCWTRRNEWSRTAAAIGISTWIVSLILAAVLAAQILEVQYFGQAALESRIATWSAVLLLCVVRPLTEEAVLRVYLTRELRRISSARDTLLLNGIFSALYGHSAMHAVSNFAFGIAMTLVTLRTERVWLTPIAHTAYAFLALAIARSLGTTWSQSIPIQVALVLLAIGSSTTLYNKLCKNIETLVSNGPTQRLG